MFGEEGGFQMMEVVLTESQHFQVEQMLGQIEPDAIAQLVVIEMQRSEVVQRVKRVRFHLLNVRVENRQVFELAILGEGTVGDDGQVQTDQFQRAQVDQIELDGSRNLMHEARVELDGQLFEIVSELDECSRIDRAYLVAGEVEPLDAEALEGIARYLSDLIVIQNELVVDGVGRAGEVRNLIQLFTTAVDVTESNE